MLLEQNSLDKLLANFLRIELIRGGRNYDGVSRTIAVVTFGTFEFRQRSAGVDLHQKDVLVFVSHLLHIETEVDIGEDLGVGSTWKTFELVSWDTFDEEFCGILAHGESRL